MEILNRFSGRMNLPDVKDVLAWMAGDVSRREVIFSMVGSSESRVGVNALWVLTHSDKVHDEWLRSKQDVLIDHLLAETNVGKRRMLLQLLRNQEYDKDSMRADFLDFCLSKINAECEPYAIRCFSMYCAFKMCRHYSELLEELKIHLSMLAAQSLSPGLKSALNNINSAINKMER